MEAAAQVERDRIAADLQTKNEQAAAQAESIEEKAGDAAYCAAKPVEITTVKGQRQTSDWKITVSQPFVLAKFHPDLVDIKPRLADIKRALNDGREVKGIEVERVHERERAAPCGRKRLTYNIMKLDRNENPDGRGKYALINLRKVQSVSGDPHNRTQVECAMAALREQGVLSFGNEAEGEQFFVMKYKDVFTSPALRAYAEAVLRHIRDQFDNTISEKILLGVELTDAEKEKRLKQITTVRALNPYWLDIYEESLRASRVGNKIPD